MRQSAGCRMHRMPGRHIEWCMSWIRGVRSVKRQCRCREIPAELIAAFAAGAAVALFLPSWIALLLLLALAVLGVWRMFADVFCR